MILLDQLSKQWIVNHIPLNAIRKCVPGIFSLTYLRNYGVYFAESAVVLYVITLAVVGALAIILLKY